MHSWCTTRAPRRSNAATAAYSSRSLDGLVCRRLALCVATTDINDPLLGRVLDGRFTVQSVLGRGGMGVVYRALQASLERSVALKVMTLSAQVPELDDAIDEHDADFQRRFFLEAATGAKLKHPNTITVFDYGSTQIDDVRVFFIAMELLDGVTLSKLMSQGRALEPLRAVSIGIQVCRSLREAHKAGVVHRDLKPGNVMIVKQDAVDEAEGDFVKVLDFGLAKTRVFDGARTINSAVLNSMPANSMTRAGTFMGSPRYVAPEQIEARAVDGRSDIYSFGCLMYRMLSGRVPFDGEQAVEIMLKHLHEPVPPLALVGVPASLIDLVMQCLQKLPADRPANMDEVIARLKRVREDLGGVTSGALLSSPSMTSLSEHDALPVELVVRTAAEVARTTASMNAIAAPPTMPLTSAASASPPPHNIASGSPIGAGVAGFSLGGILSVDDSTRPTRVLGHVARLGQPPKRPWLAMAAGLCMGLLLCLTVVLWRTGGINHASKAYAAWRLKGSRPVAGVATEPGLPDGSFAQRAKLRIKTIPPGADVLEEIEGLPRLLGVTPLTIGWDVNAAPRARHFTLKKDGFVSSTANVEPPSARGSEVVWLDVDAALRPQRAE